MKLLLIIAAVIEAVTGLALLLIPTVAVSALLGAPLDTATGLVAARIAGAALVAMGHRMLASKKRRTPKFGEWCGGGHVVL